MTATVDMKAVGMRLGVWAACVLQYILVAWLGYSLVTLVSLIGLVLVLASKFLVAPGDSKEEAVSTARRDEIAEAVRVRINQAYKLWTALGRGEGALLANAVLLCLGGLALGATLSGPLVLLLAATAVLAAPALPLLKKVPGYPDALQAAQKAHAEFQALLDRIPKLGQLKKV